MKGTGIATWAAAAAMTATAGFAAGEDQAEGPAAAVVLPAMSATSPSGDVRVTVVEGRANAALALTVRALVVQPDALASWVLLPLTEIPQRLMIPDDQSIICIDRSTTARRVIELSLQGEEIRSRTLASLLPGSSSAAELGSINLAFSASGPCLAVDVGGMEVALVGVGAAHGGTLEVCSVVTNEGPARSVDTFLRESRDLLRAGDEVAARTTLEDAKRAHPTDPRVYQQLARIHRSSGDQVAQLDCLQEGLLKSHGAPGQTVTSDWQVGTPEARLVLEYVETTRQVRGDDEAGKAVGEALTLYPCMEQAVILRAELLFAAGKDVEAIASLERATGALEGSGELGPALHDIGRFLERQGREDLALVFMERAYGKGEFSEFLIRDIADLHVRANQPARAAGWLSRLESHWASVTNGGSGVERTLRGHRRLADLRREIDDLKGSGAVVTDP